MARPVAILVRNYAPLSAVGADIEGMRAVLEAAGHTVEIFAGEGALAHPLESYRSFAASGAATLLHHTIAWPAGTLAFLRAAAPRFFRYHNVTPPGSFLPYSPAWAMGAALGRLETRLILARGGLSLLLAASEFSAAELRDRGAPAWATHVLAPYDRPPDGIAGADPTTLERLDDGRSNLLFVGRLSPHKGQHHLVEALAAWVARWPEDPARLLLVGACDERLSGYHRRLQALVARHRLGAQVELLGSVSPAVLEACYQRATVFLLASHHEGFCLPIVESFRRGVPVVAVSRTAVPETAGDAAILLDDFNPLGLAEAAHGLAMDPLARARLVAAGTARLASRYDPSRWATRCAKLLLPLIG